VSPNDRHSFAPGLSPTALTASLEAQWTGESFEATLFSRYGEISGTERHGPTNPLQGNAGLAFLFGSHAVGPACLSGSVRPVKRIVPSNLEWSTTKTQRAAKKSATLCAALAPWHDAFRSHGRCPDRGAAVHYSSFVGAVSHPRCVVLHDGWGRCQLLFLLAPDSEAAA